MSLRKLEMPKKLEFERESQGVNYARFTAEPFERGYAATVGNSVRRILLSSIQGAAITSVKIQGVSHEFTTVSGMVEDVTEVLLNLKGVKLKVRGETPRKLYLDVQGDKQITVADFQPDEEVEWVNADHHIATLNGKSAKLSLEADVDLGRGYEVADKHRKEEAPEGTIPLDAIFTPVTKVAFHVENTRVGQITDYERLIMDIWTDGRISPEDALGYAAQILRDHLSIFINVEESPVEQEEELMDAKADQLHEVLMKGVDELELSVRAANCLKVASIKSLYDLVQKGEPEMLKYRNFGRKSLNEIRDILSGMGLSFGMKLESKVHELGKLGRASKADAARAAAPAAPAV